ncbi:putative receptor-like protein kinase [Carex littledalei]|uniref:Putative receptor-like protein kinase n=1 Tax=Carex littledalei TaxID=544730 RepID=A0A833QEI1_9POAL|nr:putative receptor-like protein kinase [Carex littledalei]
MEISKINNKGKFLRGSRSSSCGELGNITYQLPGTCNWKVYELQCNGNDTVLYIGTTTYLVKDRWNENQTLRLVDPDLAEGACRLPKQTFTWSQYPNLFTWYNQEETYDFVGFFSCTEGVEDSTYKLIHCMDGPHSRVYAAYLLYWVDAGNTPKSCRYVGRTPANYDVQIHWNDTDGVELMRMLRQGFLVSWNMTHWPFFYGLENDEKHCSLLPHCWSSTKRNVKYIMRHNYSSIGAKLHAFLSIQTTFLECFQQQSNKYGPNSIVSSKNPHIYSPVVFAFVLILVALLDILLILLVLDTYFTNIKAQD